MYRLEVKVHSRGGKGGGSGSIVASAAYRSGSRLVENAAYRAGEAIEHGGEVHDFTRKGGVVFSEIHTPMDAPERFNDRGELWRAVETSEVRKDARLAREIVVSIPRGLDREQGIDLVRGFVSAELVERGMIVDACFHDVKARDGERNFHAHLLCTTRHVGPEGFGLKAREWNKRELVQTWREAWRDHCNYALEQAGRAERVDHRSLEAQRKDAAERGDWTKAATLDREPQPKLGPRAAALEKRGIETKRGSELRAIEQRNAARAAIYERVGQLSTKAKAMFLAMRDRLGDALQAAERLRSPERALQGEVARSPERTPVHPAVIDRVAQRIRQDRTADRGHGMEM